MFRQPLQVRAQAPIKQFIVYTINFHAVTFEFILVNKYFDLLF